MNEITTLPQTPAVTMTSLEIVDVINSSRKLRAQQTGKPFKALRHDNAKRLIDSCVSREVFTLPQIEETSFTGVDGRTQTVTNYRLDKRSALIVTAQLSPEFAASIIDRLEQLESALRLRAPVNPIEFIDRSRIIYLGQEHDPSLAGMFYAAMVGRVYGSRKAAKKLGYQQGFVESVMRLSDSDLAKMGEKAQGSTTEMVADAMKLRAVGAPLQIEKW